MISPQQRLLQFFIYLFIFLTGVVEAEAGNVWKASKLVPAGVEQLEQTGTNIFTCLPSEEEEKRHLHMLSMLICTTDPFIPPVS